MGNHAARGKSPIIVPTTDLQMLTFQVWTTLNRSSITAYGTFKKDDETKSYNIGGHVLDYDVLHLPSLGQTVFCIGDEIRSAWRELSHPKNS